MRARSIRLEFSQVSVAGSRAHLLNLADTVEVSLGYDSGERRQNNIKNRILFI